MYRLCTMIRVMGTREYPKDLKFLSDKKVRAFARQEYKQAMLDDGKQMANLNYLENDKSMFEATISDKSRSEEVTKPTVDRKKTMRPMNESRLHFKTKYYLWEQLKMTNALSIIKMCNTTHNLHAPSVGPFWSCTQTCMVENWIVSWDEVKMEYNMKAAGKFDVAMLQSVPDSSKQVENRDGRSDKLIRGEVCRNSATLSGLDKGSKSIKCVVEVLNKSPMAPSKISHLQRKGIKWIEVQAHLNLYNPTNCAAQSENNDEKLEFHVQLPIGKLQRLHLPFGWKAGTPLLVKRSSDGDWTCPICQLGHNGIVFESIAAIIDVYGSSPAKNGYAKITRYVYGIYSRQLSNLESAFQRRSKHLYLVEATQKISIGPFGVNTVNGEGFLVATTHNTIHSEKRDFDYLFAHYKKLLDLFASDELIVDIKLEWPGERIKEFFQKRDRLAGLVGVESMNNVYSVFPSISRILDYSYQYDHRKEQWVKSKVREKP